MNTYVVLGIIFLAMWGLLYLIFRAAQKHSKKLQEEKHKPEPLVRTKKYRFRK